MEEQRKQDPFIPFDIADLINIQIAGGKKNVRDRIHENEDEFHARYSHIKHFVSMGFSFNEIDLPYIEKIVEVNQNFSEADWVLYWHSDGEREKYIAIMKSIGADVKNKVCFRKW